MRKMAFLVAVLVMTWAAPAFAQQDDCPTEMKEIDAALAKKPRLSAGDLDRVKKLRAEGEAQHKAGKQTDCMQTLDKAKTMLGI